MNSKGQRGKTKLQKKVDSESMEKVLFSSGEQTQKKCTETESEGAALNGHTTRRRRLEGEELESVSAALNGHTTRRRRPEGEES